MRILVYSERLSNRRSANAQQGGLLRIRWAPTSEKQYDGCSWFKRMPRFLCAGIHLRTAVNSESITHMMEMPKCLDLIACTMVFTIYTCNFDAESILDALKHVPDLF